MEQKILGWWIGAIAAGAGLVGLAVAGVRHLQEEPPPPPPPIHLAFDAPAGSVMGAGDESFDAAISPDQREVVFAATTGGVAQLWRRVLATGRTEVVRGTEGARFPAWKQDGRTIAFFAEGMLRQVPPAGGAASDLADAPAPGGAAWMPDGALLYSPSDRSPIRRMLHGAVTDATRLAPGDRRHLFPAAAGASGSFTYVAVREDGRRTIRLAGAGADRELGGTTGHAQLAGTFVVYARDGVLLAQPVDPPPGAPVRSTALSPSVGISPAGHGMFAVSPRLLLFADAAPAARDIAWLDPATAELTRIAEPGDYWQLRLSPDDRAAAVTAVDPLLRTLDVFIIPSSAPGDVLPLSRALAADTDPVFSADGATVVFRSMQGGRPMLFTRPRAGGAAVDEPVRGNEPGDTATDWNARGLLVHTAPEGAAGSDIWLVEPGTGSRTAVSTGAFNQTDGRWSPNGQWVAYVSDESGAPEIYAARASGDGARVRVSFAGGSRPRWSRDGRSIYFVRGTRIVRADRAQGDDRFTAAAPVFEAAGLRDFDVGHRSDRLAVLVAAPSASEPTVRAVVDWSDPLNR